MDLCGDLDLTILLLDLPQGGAASTTTRIPPESLNTGQGPLSEQILEQVQLLAAGQNSHKEEIKLMVQGISKELTNCHKEQIQQLQRTMDKQLKYLHEQFTAALNWRLKHHHTEILEEMKQVLNPVTDQITQVQNDVWKCSKHLETMHTEVNTIKNQSLRMFALSDVSVQTGGNDQLTRAQQPRLQSTMQAWDG